MKKELKEKNENKKQLIYFGILLLTFLVLILSSTFAYYSVTSSQTKDATKVYSGELSINYIDGNIIEAKLFPIATPTYDTVDYVYKNNFSVSSSGTIEQSLNIYLDITNNEFTGNDLKYAIYDRTDTSNITKLSTGSVGEDTVVTMLSNQAFPSSDTRNYTLLLWLEETNQNQDINRGKSLTATIRVEAVQARY